MIGNREQFFTKNERVAAPSIPCYNRQKWHSRAFFSWFPLQNLRNAPHPCLNRSARDLPRSARHVLPARIFQGYLGSPQQFAALLREGPQEIHTREDALGTVEESLGAQSPRADFRDPITYVKFVKTTMEFAIPPHARRRRVAEATGINSRPASWKCISPTYAIFRWIQTGGALALSAKSAGRFRMSPTGWGM